VIFFFQMFLHFPSKSHVRPVLLCYILLSSQLPCTIHSIRAVWCMNCLRPFGRWDHGFESHSRHGCLCVRLFCVCLVLCLGSGLATSWSLVQRVLAPLKNYYAIE
jgi:hypothetical protein